MKNFICSLLSCMAVFSCLAQQPIVIESKQLALVLETNADNLLCSRYFGPRLQHENEYSHISQEYRMNDGNNSITNSAYTPAGTWNLLEPAIEVKQADGNHSLELKYVSHSSKAESPNVSLTSIVLKDPLYPIEVKLQYRVYKNENVIEQWAVISNKGKQPVTLYKYASANLYFTAKKFYLRHYHGEWAREMMPEEELLTAGIKTLDSKLGTRANLFQPPSFALSFDQPGTENEGQVLLGTLAWTGNFRFDFEKDSYDHLRLIAGINPFASQYELGAAKELTTPAFIYSYSAEGIGSASRQMHDWARSYRIPNGNGSRMTLLNNWEATYFDFDENKLTSLFKGAHSLGVDLFLLDDGWFGNKYPRNDDHAGLGDWQENVKKLPHGIPYLVDQAEKAGIKFGIWVEPEMVNPKSELYEKHRNWVIRQPNRKEYYFRNQLVLDLSNPAVQQFVFGVLDSLMIKNPRLAYIKWDCNAVMYNAYSAFLQQEKIPQSHLYVDYVKGLYGVLQKFRQKYPDIELMLCSGGGGRVDYGALSYFSEYWPSDNTDPLDRIYIQWENSLFFPTIASCNHVTEASHAPMKYKIDVAMMGKLGFDIVVDRLSEKDRTFATAAVKQYNDIKDIIWHGDLYRLIDPWSHPYAALMFNSPDKKQAVFFQFLTNARYNSNLDTDPVLLQGLDPEKQYRLQEINLYPGQRSALRKDAIYSGDFLMKVGINTGLASSHSSVVIKLEAM